MAEARRLAAQQHPHLVQLYGVHLMPSRRRFELVMERMHCSLAQGHADSVVALHRSDSPLLAARKAVHVLLQVQRPPCSGHACCLWVMVATSLPAYTLGLDPLLHLRLNQYPKAKHPPDISSQFQTGACIQSASTCPISMSLLPGRGLNETKLPFPMACVQSVLRHLPLQVASALTFLHARGVVMLDLKPSNVMLAAPDGLVVKLSDYGFAAAREQNSALGRRASAFTAPELRQVGHHTAFLHARAAALPASLSPKCTAASWQVKQGCRSVHASIRKTSDTPIMLVEQSPKQTGQLRQQWESR